MNAIRFCRNSDGTWTLYYFDNIVGHVDRVRYLRSQERVWRAVMHVTGQIHYARSKEAARRVLMENYA